MKWHRVDADPDQTFYFDADPDPDPNLTSIFTHVGKFRIFLTFIHSSAT
jgi:hypothetical protein